MLNDDNSKVLIGEKNPLKITKISDKGSFACRRSIGEGFYDANKNRTYICWNERGMDIYIAYYDHSEQKWSAKELVYKCDLFKRWDYHDYVTMIPDKNGEPILFYNVHVHTGYIIKKNNEGKWIRKSMGDEKNAYPAPIKYGDVIYYFYSENREQSYPYRPLCYKKSYDEGESWTEPKDVIDTAKKTEDKVDEVYQTDVIYAANPDRFIISWTMWGGERHAASGKGAFAVAFHLEDEKCYDLSGKCLGEEIDYETMMNSTCVEPDELSKIAEYRHSTYGPISVVDSKNETYICYGIRNEKETSLYISQYKDSRFTKKCIDNRMWNVLDARAVDQGIEFAVCYGKSVVIFRKEDNNDEFFIKSVTEIPHENNSNSVPYLNFISGNKKQAELILGLFDQDDIDKYYEGLWPVLVLSE